MAQLLSRLLRWMRRRYLPLVALAVVALSGCAGWLHQRGVKQNASVVDYLYPNANVAPRMKAGLTYLRPPVRVGIAFVPGGSWGSGLPEAEKMKLLERVSAAFCKQGFIEAIEVIPSAYLQPKGGFTNLEQVARMFNVEVVALLSYDQVQFHDTSALSVLYWTIVGAYVVHGEQYDVQTLVDASVFDVNTQMLLLRAPGTSQIKGGASMASYSERSRAAQIDGYNKAVDKLIPQLQTELDNFKERIKTDTAFKVESKPGYSGAGDIGWLSLAMAFAVLRIGYAKRRAS